MTPYEHPHPAFGQSLANAAGLRFELLSHGGVRRIDYQDLMLNLFLGNEMEEGASNLWLRLHGADGSLLCTPLLGPASPLRVLSGSDGSEPGVERRGEWQGLRIHLQLRLALMSPSWFWHVQIENLDEAQTQTVDLLAAQDVGLSAYGSTRLNEYYVSHYLDLSALVHPEHGFVLAARQNLAQSGRNPWLMLGSLRQGHAYATDAMQLHGLKLRAGQASPGLQEGLPSERLQHEHAMLVLQDEALRLAPGAHAELGFWGSVMAHHPGATSDADLAQVDQVLSQAEARPPRVALFAHGHQAAVDPAAPSSLFGSSPWLASEDLDAAQLRTLFGVARCHEEWQGDQLLAFNRSDLPAAHIVLRAKELQVQRPHGALLRTGQSLQPDESALTSTVWMSGVFHSMLTQGHVSINRYLSTVRSWLGLYRSQGLRLFVEIEGHWQQLGLPSAFEMEPEACRWIYAQGSRLIEVRSRARSQPHSLSLELSVLQGPPLRVLVSQHIALAGDDGSAAAPAVLQRMGDSVYVLPPPGSELDQRFPASLGFRVTPTAGTVFARVAGDELLFSDGRSQGQPYLCIESDVLAQGASWGLSLSGHLLEPAELAAESDLLTLPRWQAPSQSALAPAAQRLAEILPWYRHNALIHYLSPRGLEQFSGGGWGTRDVCQGPLEMLLALGRVAPVRELLQRVFAAQNADGDWPQWFMFFERERANRAGDSHGDVVFWPLLALARYLIASEDAAFLDERLPFYTPEGEIAQEGTLWQHVQRALAVIQARHIEGTQLVAYGHGDWNDSLQPADPQLRERMCSAWTVTLHQQVLQTLSRALQLLGREDLALPLADQAMAVQEDFQRLLVVDGVITGYALFPAIAQKPFEPPALLLHPQDSLTGLRYSLLPMMHAVLNNMLSPAQARAHLLIMQTELQGPDGARLFDQPLAYRGGTQKLFQRAETSAFFGREIGVMYMHAHLRYAEMLAHLGEAETFFTALSQSHPLGLQALVPTASLRQANCYFSSSDAAFPDRYVAQFEYGQIAAGQVALDGGWRVYSSGPGIALGLVLGSFLGLRQEKRRLLIDPVMPAALCGLRAQVELAGRALQLEYQLGERGFGPRRLSLNGRDLDFVREPNPYREGAAVVEMAALLALLDEALARAPQALPELLIYTA